MAIKRLFVFQGDAGFAVTSWIFFLHLFQKRNFLDKWHGFSTVQDALPITKPTVSKHRIQLKALTSTRQNHRLASSFLHTPLDSQEKGHCFLYTAMPAVPRQYTVQMNHVGI